MALNLKVRKKPEKSVRNAGILRQAQDEEKRQKRAASLLFANAVTARALSFPVRAIQNVNLLKKMKQKKEPALSARFVKRAMFPSVAVALEFFIPAPTTLLVNSQSKPNRPVISAKNAAHL